MYESPEGDFLMTDLSKKETESIEAKIAELEAKRLETTEKLKTRLKFFRGIHHEGSDSEYKANLIKVLEAHIQSLTEEIDELKGKLGPGP